MNMDSAIYGFRIQEKGKDISIQDFFNRYYLEDGNIQPLNDYQKDFIQLMESNKMIIVKPCQQTKIGPMFGISLVDEINKIKGTAKIIKGNS